MREPPFTIYGRQDALVGLFTAVIGALTALAVLVTGVRIGGLLGLLFFAASVGLFSGGLWLMARHRAVSLTVTADRVVVRNAYSKTVLDRADVTGVHIVQSRLGQFSLGLRIGESDRLLTVSAVQPWGWGRPKAAREDFHQAVAEIAVSITGDPQVSERIVRAGVTRKGLAVVGLSLVAVACLLVIGRRWPDLSAISNALIIMSLGLGLGSMYRLR